MQVDLSSTKVGGPLHQYASNTQQLSCSMNSVGKAQENTLLAMLRVFVLAEKAVE